MTVEKNGQLAWTFEELDLRGAQNEVIEEVLLISKQLCEIDSFKYPRTYNALYKRFKMLNSVWDNLSKMILWGCVA